MTATSLNQFLPVLMALSVGAQELLVRLPEIIHLRLKACIWKWYCSVQKYNGIVQDCLTLTEQLSTQRHFVSNHSGQQNQYRVSSACINVYCGRPVLPKPVTDEIRSFWSSVSLPPGRNSAGETAVPQITRFCLACLAHHGLTFRPPEPCMSDACFSWTGL